MIVARGLSLVSAAQSSDDAGIGEPEPRETLADAGLDAANGGGEKPPVDFAHGNPGRRPPPRLDEHGDPHDKDTQADDEALATDAGHDDSELKHR